jgi:uncharacterized membrane protein YeaQ/YmgE (transglycosylase-associated protein family)
MTWLISIVIGGIIGWLGSIVMKTNAQMGMLANVIVGIVGSSLGAWVAGLLGFTASSPAVGYLVSVAGAAILIGLLKALGIFK